MTKSNFEMREIDLGQEGIAFVRKQLCAGGKYSKLLSRLPLERGRALSFLPDSLDLGKISSHEESIFLKFGVRIHHSRSRIVKLIIEHLQSSDRPIALFETMMRVGDDSPSMRRLPVVTHKQEVYFSISPAQANLQGIEEVITFARHYPLIGGLALLYNCIEEFKVSREISPDQMEFIATNTLYIVFGAYDGEGYVVWHRQP